MLWTCGSTLVVVLALGACGSSGGSGTAVNAGPSPEKLALPMVAAGFRTSAWLGADRSVLEWGDNASGEVGDGSTTRRMTPTAVRGLGPADKGQDITFGDSHVLLVTTDGRVLAWGHNKSGQLGDGETVDRPRPHEVAGLHNIRAVAAGASFSLALGVDGAVRAWGNNQSGQLGDGNAPIDHASPATVQGLGPGSGVVRIAAGLSFGLVLKRDGSVLAWGNGTSGQLGIGSSGKVSAPTQVRGLGPGSGVVAIAAGGSFALALKADGTLLAWGNNASGQLGDGSAPKDHAAPVPVRGIGRGSGVVAIAAGATFALALKRDGTVRAWGNNASGQLGDGTSPHDHATPVAVVGLGARQPMKAIAAGGSHSLATRADGSTVAWGNNSSGQLGDNTAPTDHATPVAVAIPRGSR